MSTLALELNDSGLVAVRASESDRLVIPESPGYALLEGESFLTGVEARDRARLRPRFSYTRFWDAIDTSSLSRPFPTKLSKADLAHTHLSRFWDGLGGAKDAMLAVPSWYSLDQLGLILGMARACDINVAGMIDSALAAAATVRDGRALIHLDLHLHRASAARILRHDQLIREDTVVDETVGVVPLHDSWATHIAESFVRQTRYDPLHRAQSEQELYNQLLVWLPELLEQSSIAASLGSSAKKQSIELERDQLVESADSYYRALVKLASSVLPSEGPVTLLLSHRLAGLPGLVDRLRRDVTQNLVELPAYAAAAGALSYEKKLREEAESDGGLTFLTKLDLSADGSAKQPLPDATKTLPSGKAPSHIVHEGTAYPIEPGPFLLGIAIPDGSRGLTLSGETAGISRYHCSLYRSDDRVLVEDHSKFGSFVNGKRFDDKAAVSVGDRLRLGTPGVELLLIEVES